MAYYRCLDTCYQDEAKYEKVNILDTLLNRTLEDKIHYFCRFFCAKSVDANSFKHNGTWIFQPICGIEQFYSFLFSILSCLVQSIFFFCVLNPKLTNNRFSNMLRIQFFLSFMTFLSSAIFHIHENNFTKIVDYILAFLSISFFSYVAIIRTMRAYGPVDLRKMIFVKLILMGYYIFHFFMFFHNGLHYTFNVYSCVFVIIVGVIAYIKLFLQYWDFNHIKYLLIYSIIFLAALIIESLDHPPNYYLIDSHAMWHMFTCIAAPFFILFLKTDIEMFGIQ